MAQMIADQSAAVQNVQDYATHQASSMQPTMNSSRPLSPGQQIKQSQQRQKEQRMFFLNLSIFMILYTYL